MHLASYLEGGPLMWMMPLHLHVNQKSDYDDDDCSQLHSEVGDLSIDYTFGADVDF